MSSETALAFQWVASTMKADAQLMAAATGGIRQSYAPPGIVPPYAQYGRQSGADVDTVNKIRLWAGILMQIKGVGPITSYPAIVIIADRIDELFADVRTVALPQGGIISCYREQEVEYPELVAGAQWENLGGLYRIALKGS